MSSTASRKLHLGRADWMEPEYGLRRPELALVLDLAAGRVARRAFARELERLDWPRAEAAELGEMLSCLLRDPAPAARGGSE